MEQFLATLLTIVIVVYALKYVFVLVMPWLLKRFAKSMMKKAGFTPPEDEGRDDPEKPKRRKTRFGWGRDEEPLKVRRRQGQTLSDILGGEYIPYEEVGQSR